MVWKRWVELIITVVVFGMGELLAFRWMTLRQEHTARMWYDLRIQILANWNRWRQMVQDFFQYPTVEAERKKAMPELVEVLRSVEEFRKQDTSSWVMSRILYRELTFPHNRWLLSGGKNLGIQEDCAVISSQGFLGWIESVSFRASVMIPLLDENLRIPVILVPGGGVGLLIWRAPDYRSADVHGIPMTIPVHPGDSVYTYEGSFWIPDRIFVGTVQQVERDTFSGMWKIQVHLHRGFLEARWVGIWCSLVFNVPGKPGREP